MKKSEGKEATENRFTTEEINKHIKDYLISFIEDFSSPENDKKNIQYRRTTIEVKRNGKKIKLPFIIATSAHKDEESVVRKIRFVVNLII